VRRPFYGVLLAPALELAGNGGQRAGPHDPLLGLAAFPRVAALASGLIGGMAHRRRAAAMIVGLSPVAVVLVVAEARAHPPGIEADPPWWRRGRAGRAI
jgi:hypothetical protein